MKRQKLRRLELPLGQTIILVKDTVDDRGNERRIALGEWDVIKVNKKSIVLQNWPTYERRIIKF